LREVFPLKADKESFNILFPHFLFWFYNNTFCGSYFPWRRTKSLSIYHFHIFYFDSTIIPLTGVISLEGGQRVFQYTISTFSILILQLYLLRELFPLKADKESFNILFPHFLYWFYNYTFNGSYFPWRRTKSLSIHHFHIFYFDSTIIPFAGVISLEGGQRVFQYTISTFSILILQLYLLRELFPLKADKESFNIPFPHFLLWFYNNTFNGSYFPWRRTKSLSIHHFHIFYFDSTIIPFAGVISLEGRQRVFQYTISTFPTLILQ
jgi:hypothetical protein